MCGIKALLREYRNTTCPLDRFHRQQFSVGNELIILVVFHLGGPISFTSLM